MDTPTFLGIMIILHVAVFIFGTTLGVILTIEDAVNDGFIMKGGTIYVVEPEGKVN